jgi:hypothetical protein
VKNIKTNVYLEALSEHNETNYLLRERKKMAFWKQQIRSKGEKRTLKQSLLQQRLEAQKHGPHLREQQKVQ